MFVQVIYLSKYDWYVTILYEYNIDNPEDNIFQHLIDTHQIPISIQSKIYYNLKDTHNTAITYSNVDSSKSIMLLGRHTSSSEIYSSLNHELYHVVTHICKSFNIKEDSEEAAYLMGYLTKRTLKFVKKYICNTCN